jgi:hypothetical protein
LVFRDSYIDMDDGSRRGQGSRSWFAVPTEPGSFFPRHATFRTVRADQAVSGAPDFPVHYGSIYRSLLDEALALTSTVVVRREALRPTDRFTEAVAIFEDWEFFARVSERHDAAFLDVTTAVNRGHGLPGRVTSCSHLARAECYLAMVERVWKADEAFVRANPVAVTRAEAHALLAVAREAVLASRAGQAREALARWRRLGDRSRAGWAAVYGATARVPAGSQVLRQVLRARTLWRLLTMSRRRGYSVNPAA